MPNFDFTKTEKNFLPGFEHKSGLHQTETGIVDIGSEAIGPGDLVIASKSSPMGDVLVKKATSSIQESDFIRGFALRKTNIASHESCNYLPGELVPIRRFGEVVITLDALYLDPKIGQYVFFKEGKFVSDGKGGVQVGRIKDLGATSSDRVGRLVLLDIQIGPEYDSSGSRKFTA